jgi:predicted acetyltransferase
MAIEIRPYTDPDLRPFAWTEGAASGYVLGPESLDRYERFVERDRLLCAMDGGAVVGTTAAISYQLTIPGGTIAAAGITAVGVLPSHRRQGILRGMMRRQLDDVRARGEPVAILWASEGAIYPHFGYGLATLDASFDIERTWTAFRDAAPPDGRVRLIDAGQAAIAWPPVYEQILTRIPGLVSRSPDQWDLLVISDPEHKRRGAGPKFFALYEQGGNPEGYACYRIQEEWDERGPKSVLRVVEATGTTDRAVRELWRFLFGIDLIHTIHAGRQPVDHPLLLMLAHPRRLGLTLGDGLWLRLVELPAALAARSYAAEGSLVLEVRDAFCPWNAGRWRLDVDGGTEGGESSRVDVGRTDEDADLSVDATDLASTYLGGFTFAQLTRAGRAREERPGGIARADRLFATERRPWCLDQF